MLSLQVSVKNMHTLKFNFFPTKVFKVESIGLDVKSISSYSWWHNFLNDRYLSGKK